MSVNIPTKNESDVASDLSIEDMFPLDMSKLRMLAVQLFGPNSDEVKQFDSAYEMRKKTYRSNASFSLLSKFMESHKGATKHEIRTIRKED